jgi:hypothetical protein
MCELDVLYWSPETGEPVFAVALWPLLSAQSSFLPTIVFFTLNPIRPGKNNQSKCSVLNLMDCNKVAETSK